MVQEKLAVRSEIRLAEALYVPSVLVGSFLGMKLDLKQPANKASPGRIC